ncbi:polyprenyl synthetase family protein [Streptomyces sp. NPDC002952]|uniref:polyprenyl synthetase family protein n=1 Tax=Streptomyces sp. NPDC002952 TaxID=3364673 RepID=UPI00369F47F4
MRRTRAGEHPAIGPAPVPPHNTREAHASSGPRGGPDTDTATAVPWHPDTVDADVPGAVGRVLDTVLRERVTQASALDLAFGADVAERVARFTRHGGKRMRPQFLWWALRGCGGGHHPAEAETALRIGAALELIQTCALVHDDVMDASALRRGRPALHVDLAAQYAGPVGRRAGALGEAGAILAGDLALAWADDVVADLVADPGTPPAVRRVWRAMRTEMVAGQYLDLLDQATASGSMARAVRAACLKSARYSVERPLALGAALAGADAATTDALCAAGRCAGVAFQLRDDLLGVFGDPRGTGKPSGDDIREGKRTYLVAVARARATQAGDRTAVEVLDRCLGDGGLTEGQLAEVRHVLTATGARTAVENRIERLAARSAQHLAAAGLLPSVRGRLHALMRTAAGVTTPGRDDPAEPQPNGDEDPTACLTGAGAAGGTR